MASDALYYPDNGRYVPIPTSIYAQYLGQCPNPCRKYHVSSAVEGAETVSAIVLPFLDSRQIFHKIVKSKSQLLRQLAGVQAGKFITIYMNAGVSLRNPELFALGQLLGDAMRKGQVHPGPRIPTSRPYANVFIEMPIDDAGFIYGGSVVDPTK